MHAILPHHCALCGATALNQILCTGCDADLSHYRVPACPVCALPTPCGQVCGACLQRPPAFDRTLAAFSYSFPVDRLLHAFKYSGNLALIEVLAKPLAQLAANHPKPDLLMPMPLHPSRLKERGFNQSLEIAKPISRWLGIPLTADACERTRDTPSQAGLKWKERRRNVRGAFACDLDLSGKSVAVLDDVMTTGATLEEISRALRRRGATTISAWVVARTAKETG
ncbi:MAG: ComF family protein [Sulfuricella sp.]|nr:ComF family protein [Sulfuricella sp.]